MKRVLAGVWLMFLFSSTGWQPVLGKEAPTSEAQLLQELNAGLKTKDKDAIMALFNWDGVPGQIEGYYSMGISEWLEQDVKNVKLEPLPKGFRSAFDLDRFSLSANVAVVGMVEVRFNGGEILPYGRKGDHFYLAGLTRKELPPGFLRALGSLLAGVPTKIMIQVLDTEGKPLPKTWIVCADADTVPQLDFNGTFLTGGRTSFQTDKDGHFTLPLANSNLFLVAANKQGFGWLPNLDLTNQAVLRMQPWGRIEGVRKNRNHFVPDEQLSLALDRDFYEGYVLAPISNLFPFYDTQTDAQGRFVFEHVPPLKWFIHRREKQRGYWGYFWSVEGKPGETTKLEINTRGRTVTGRVEATPGLYSSMEIASISGSLMSELKDRARSRCSVGFPVAADGSFHADHVEPGDYEIIGDIKRDGKRVAFIDPIRLHIPDDLSDAADVPFDIGTVTLKADLKTGNTAPDFSCRTLDDKPFKLSDFRGKYVLLDFWETWCLPCVEETPNLKATYDAFGKDERFVMVSLSLDSDPAAPRKFVRNQGIAWTQVFLGDISKDKVTRSYGISGIGAILLIGPDGNLAALNLRGSKIKEAVAAALSR